MKALSALETEQSQTSALLMTLMAQQDLANLVEHLDKASTAYSMEISAEKTKLMTNNTSGINTEIKVNGQKLESHKLQIPGFSYN